METSETKRKLLAASYLFSETQHVFLALQFNNHQEQNHIKVKGQNASVKFTETCDSAPRCCTKIFHQKPLHAGDN